MPQLPTGPTTGRPCGKVPQLIQMEALECGATSLGMVCAYYGLWVSPEKLRADCGVSRDGAKALNIVKAARSYGFDSAGYRIEPALLQREGELPCIIHWGFNHFVVLRGFKNGRALINDPARGEVEVSPEEFDEQFTGIVIKLAPNASFKPGGHKPSIWGFVRKRSLGTADGLLFVALATAIVGLLGLVPPLLAQTFTDKLIGSTDTALRVLFFAVLIALCVLQVAASALNSLYTLRTEGKLCTVGSASYMWHLMHLPMEFFGQRSAGDLVTRLGLNKSVANTVLTQLAPIFINCASALVCLGIMAYYSAPLAAAGLVASAAKVIAAKVIADKRTNFVRVAMRDKAKLSGVTVAGIQTIETLKATGAVNGFMRKRAECGVRAPQRHLGPHPAGHRRAAGRLCAGGWPVAHLARAVHRWHGAGLPGHAHPVLRTAGVAHSIHANLAGDNSGHGAHRRCHELPARPPCHRGRPLR